MKSTFYTSLWKNRPAARRMTLRFGFTVIELFVVVAIAAILAGLLLLALGRAKSKVHAIGCLNNLWQMGLSWTLYAHDHDDAVPPNNIENGASHKTWVQGWLDLKNGADNTNTTYLMASHLWPYHQSLKVWRCPMDKSTSTHGGTVYPRVRTYSMNSFMNLICDPFPWRVIRNTTDMIDPPPAKTMVLIDERAESIDDGVFSIDMAGFYILDWPGIYHDGASALDFADCHVELKKWRDPRTTPEVPKGQALFTGGTPSPDNPDVHWLQERTTSSAR